MEPTSNNLGAQQPQKTAGMRGQSYTIRPRFYNRNRIRVRDANQPADAMPNPVISPVTAPNDADFYSEESTGAREIAPTVDPVSDFRPVNPDAPATTSEKSKSSTLGIIIAILFSILTFAAGLVVGLNWDKLFTAKPTPTTPEKTTVDIRDLTSSEIADLSKKVNYLTISNADSDFLSMDYYRLFPSIANNTLSNTDKLSIVIYSLRDEYVRTDGCQSKDCANAPATVSAERVASRYHEIFGTNLVYAESAYCPSYSLSADKATYTVSEGCGGATDNYDLLFKEGYYYKDGYAYVDVAIGSRFNGENGTIYNDYYTAADKTAVKTIADFPSAEEFLAFQITADNAKDFALYTLKFKASDANNYYFVEASKTERKAEEPATPAEQPTQGSQNCKDAANEASTETTDCAEPATPEGQPTETPAAPASEDAAPESSDDISYETDPDAPPCPRSNPYARCVE